MMPIVESQNWNYYTYPYGIWLPNEDPKLIKTPRTIPGKLRHVLFVKYNYKCNECGASKEETTLEIDHIIPWSKGGQTHIDNLQVLCKKCNRSKHARILVGDK